ncbi:hypothetical protein PZA11_007097 [Diplocarpon coronariae]
MADSQLIHEYAQDPAGRNSTPPVRLPSPIDPRPLQMARRRQTCPETAVSGIDAQSPEAGISTDA